jgi:hypothetical protein
MVSPDKKAGIGNASGSDISPVEELRGSLQEKNEAGSYLMSAKAAESERCQQRGKCLNIGQAPEKP